MEDMIDEIIKQIDTPLRRRSREIVVNISRYRFITDKALSPELIAKETGIKLIGVKTVLNDKSTNENDYNKIEQYVLRKLKGAKQLNE